MVACCGLDCYALFGFRGGLGVICGIVCSLFVLVNYFVWIAFVGIMLLRCCFLLVVVWLIAC